MVHPQCRTVQPEGDFGEGVNDVSFFMFWFLYVLSCVGLPLFEVPIGVRD